VTGGSTVSSTNSDWAASCTTRSQRRRGRHRVRRPHEGSLRTRPGRLDPVTLEAWERRPLSARLHELLGRLLAYWL
jgi:hypothetical protein